MPLLCRPSSAACSPLPPSPSLSSPAGRRFNPPPPEKYGSKADPPDRGYDVVAYFTQAKPVAGKADFSHSWNNAEWRFASAENRDLFAANPEKYAPQYGGWCAWAVSQGYTAPIDPEAWRIVDGKLYLNYSKSVQQRWARDVPGNISKSDRNWPGIREKLVAK